MKPINIKIMMALIEKEPGDQYVPVLKPVLMQILTEIKHLRRKNSQLGGKNARLRREKKALEIMLSAVVINDNVPTVQRGKSLTKWPSLWHSVCLSTKTANSLCANLLQKNLKKSKRLYIKRVIGR